MVLSATDLAETFSFKSAHTVRNYVNYLKDRSGECDFVVCDGNKVLQCIQVSYDISNQKTRKREISGLLLAHRQTLCRNLLLLTDHEYEELTIEDIPVRIQPVYEWCMETRIGNQ